MSSRRASNFQVVFLEASFRWPRLRDDQNVWLQPVPGQLFSTIVIINATVGLGFFKSSQRFPTTVLFSETIMLLR